MANKYAVKLNKKEHKAQVRSFFSMIRTLEIEVKQLKRIKDLFKKHSKNLFFS
jgi:hypothetical protein